MNTRPNSVGWLLAVLFLLLATFAIAQTTSTAAPAAATAAATPAVAVPPAPAGNSALVQLFTPLVSIVVTFLVRKAGNLQGWLLPVISALVGLGYDAVTAYTTGHALSPVMGILLGLAGTGLHQIKVQLTPTPPAAAGSGAVGQ